MPLGHNDNGKITLTVTNWKDARYYLTVNYRTQYNSKQAKLGWIACDGDDWNLDSFPDTGDKIDEIKRMIGGAVAEMI